ncbi:MAG: hypothetical protein ACRD0Q_08715 [Acidimicrobiales bacterium]
MSGLRLRREDVADDALVVVRGGELDKARLVRDATLTYRRFGEYGISVLAAPDEAALDLLASTTLQREPLLTLMRMGALRAAALEVRPTFRRPHFTIVLTDLDADLDRLRACDNEVRDTPYYVAPEARR